MTTTVLMKLNAKVATFGMSLSASPISSAVIWASPWAARVSAVRHFEPRSQLVMELHPRNHILCYYIFRHQTKTVGV